MQDTGVAILPGSEFGRPTQELTARIAFVDFDGSRALAATEVLPRDRPLDESFLQTYCAPVLMAIDRLCDWLKA
jgi:aspartate aminotransferase